MPNNTQDTQVNQPVNATLTSISALVNASGVLTNNGAGTLSWGAAGGAALTDLLPVAVGLRVNVNRVAPTTKVDVAARAVVLPDASNNGKIFRSVSVTIDSAASGANGLDTGTVAANTLYYVWVIGKADGTVAGLLSLSATAPTMPTGYTYKRPFSWAVMDATTHFLPFHQNGDFLMYEDYGVTQIENHVSPIPADTTLNANTALTYPTIGTALSKNAYLSIQCNSGMNQELYAADATGAKEAYLYIGGTTALSTYAWVGIDGSAQFKIHAYLTTTDRNVRIQGAKVEWY